MEQHRLTLVHGQPGDWRALQGATAYLQHRPVVESNDRQRIVELTALLEIERERVLVQAEQIWELQEQIDKAQTRLWWRTAAEVAVGFFVLGFAWVFRG